MSDPIITLAAASRQLDHQPVDISSATNPRLRHVRALFESARERRRSGQTVLDGWHLLDAWAQQGRPVQQLLLPRRIWRKLEQKPDARASGGPAVPPPAALPQARWLVLDDALFDSLDILPSPAPVIALVDAPQPERPSSIQDQDVVVLDRVQDPGNVGAIIRTAAAAGVRLLLTTPGTAACWSPKVLRSGMGGHFVLDIHEGIEMPALLEMLQLPLAGTVLDQGVSLYQQDLRPPLAWVLGNEGEGIDPGLQTRLQYRLTIPQDPGVESLNVAAATAVCLFEQRRQRLMTKPGGC